MTKPRYPDRVLPHELTIPGSSALKVLARVDELLNYDQDDVDQFNDECRLAFHEAALMVARRWVSVM